MHSSVPLQSPRLPPGPWLPPPPPDPPPAPPLPLPHETSSISWRSSCERLAQGRSPSPAERGPDERKRSKRSPMPPIPPLVGAVDVSSVPQSIDGQAYRLAPP